MAWFELRQTVFAWIEGFYNANRVQAKLGYCSPREYATLLTDTAISKAA
jgi:transposase InsO family protein